MPARDLELVRSRKRLHTAAISRDRVRFRGVVAESGDGYSGTYRNVWLRIQIAVGAVARGPRMSGLRTDRTGTHATATLRAP